MTVKHGDAHRGLISGEYSAWAHAIARCTNPKNKDFHRYGGRGISICQRWRDSYECFLSDMGRKPSSKHSIERIHNNGDYEPSNCRWATHLEQCTNRKNPTRKLTDLDVKEIETRLRNKETQNSIATRFGVSQAIISAINNHRRRWRNTPDRRRINRRRGYSKLTNLQAGKIRDLLRDGQSHSSIAALFGVSRPTISLIAENKTWRQ